MDSTLSVETSDTQTPQLGITTSDRIGEGSSLPSLDACPPVQRPNASITAESSRSNSPYRRRGLTSRQPKVEYIPDVKATELWQVSSSTSSS